MPLIKDPSDEDILTEWFVWDQKVKNAKNAATLAAAIKFRDECQREIDKKNLKYE